MLSIIIAQPLSTSRYVCSNMLPTVLSDPCYIDDRIVGIDEAGRGCLAGSVCAAAVVWPLDFVPDNATEEKNINLIKDSKRLSAKRREALAIFIKANALAYGVCMVDNKVVDDINILNATFKAMHGALDHVPRSCYDRIAVDGNRFKTYVDTSGDFVPHVCVVDGDNKVFQIAAASILAKTERDKEIMTKHDENPDLQVYKWRDNKGYGTAAHMEALRQHGASALHRMSFLGNIL